MKRDRSFEVHFGWGAAIALGLIVFGVGPVLAFVVALVAGIVVELIHWRWPSVGTASIEDVIYTAMGGLTGGILGVVDLAIQ